jgi:hypothetical protein
MVYVFPIDDAQRAQYQETSECIPRWLSVDTLTAKIERKDPDAHLLRESFPLVVHGMYHDDSFARDALEISEPESQLQITNPTSDSLFELECQCQYDGKGEFVPVWLNLSGLADLRFMSSMGAGAVSLRSLSVHDCVVGPPKNGRNGHDHVLRLDTAETDLQAKVRLS